MAVWNRKLGCVFYFRYVDMNDPLTEKIIAAAFRVHNTLGYGFYERVYENALVVELRKMGIPLSQQIRLVVTYEGIEVGLFKADLVVNKQLLIELKATYELQPKDEVQLVNYLKATGIDVGLLINFGKSVQIKRKYRTCHPKSQHPE